ADERAARFTATGRDAAHHRLGDCDIQLAADKIIQEKKRLSTLSQDIVHPHGDESDADGVVNTAHKRDFELCADAVGGSDQNRMTIGPALKVEQRAEPADAGQDSRQFGFLGNGTDTTDELVAGFDVYARFGAC